MAEVVVSSSEFVANRRHLTSRAGELIRLAVDTHADQRADPAVPLLSTRGWIPPAPLDLDAVSLRWVDGDIGRSSLRAAARQVAGYWPPDADGRPTSSYSGAVDAFFRPGALYDGLSYRLLAVAPSPTSMTFELCAGTYFDLLDTSEPLAYEAAMLHRQGAAAPLDGPYRRWLGDPFDFSRRCAIPGVSTLTVVVGAAGPYFFMHKRIGVGTADGTAHVLPAGEFQPHSPASVAHDLDVWHTVMREYTEEVGGGCFQELGDVEIDYSAVEPCATLDARRRSGRGLTAWFLGVGLYPLTWKPEILTVCVFDEAAFVEAFPTVGLSNHEGTLLVGASGSIGIPFRENEVVRFADSDATLPAGRACLRLAWRWRRQLGIPGVG